MKIELKDIPKSETWDTSRSSQFLALQEKARGLNKTSEVHNDIRYGDYFLNESGLYYSPNDTDGENGQKKTPIWISSPLWPVASLRDSENRNHAVLLKIYDGEKEHLWPMPRQIIAK